MKVDRIVLCAVFVTGLGLLLPMSSAFADTPNQDVPDLANCPQLAHETFETYSGQVIEIPCVRALKQNLDAVGYRNVELLDYSPPIFTGLYDAETWQDVWRFQAAHAADGLEPTGDADYSTIQVLDRVANSPAALGDNGQNIAAPSAPNPEVYFVDSEKETGEMPDDCATSCGKEGGGEAEPLPAEPAPIQAP